MIVSFYSYKGGVGRTQLCANVAAYLCYQRKKRVLVWDWDYEAPGLHYFFGKKNSDITGYGTIEILEAYTALMRSSKEKVEATDLKYITKENITELVKHNDGCIDLVAAGKYDNDFSFRATNFDWFEFYNMLDGVNYIEQLKEQLKQLKYDYILIDSRTGISDYSGICNIQLPDVNVMVIAATMQNFEGCKSIIEKIKNAEYLKIVGREARILPVLSRVDTGVDKYNEWALRFKEYFSAIIRNLDKEFDELFLNEVFTNVYYKDTFIPYTQAFSAGENILFREFEKTQDTDVTSRPFRNIAEYLEDIKRDKTIRFYKGIGERDWLRYATEAETPRKAAIAFTQVAIKQSDADAIISYCEKAIDKDKNYYLPYYHAAIALSTKSESFKAIKYFEQTIRLNPNFVEAYYLLATEYLNSGKIEKGENLLYETLRLSPNHTEASKKLESLEVGHIPVNELKVREDEFFNTYVNTQIEQSKQAVETSAQRKIKRSNWVAILSISIAVISSLIILIQFNNSKKQSQAGNIPQIDSLDSYKRLSDSLAKEKQALKTIESVSNKVSSEAKDTAKITPRVYEAAKILDTTVYLDFGNWVYLGQIINRKLTNSHFKINEIPKIGDLITARDAVYKRKDLPIELKNGNWKLGDIRGVVGGDESVKVLVVKEIQDQNYWALVQ